MISIMWKQLVLAGSRGGHHPWTTTRTAAAAAATTSPSAAVIARTRTTRNATVFTQYAAALSSYHRLGEQGGGGGIVLRTTTRTGSWNKNNDSLFTSSTSKSATSIRPPKNYSYCTTSAIYQAAPGTKPLPHAMMPLDGHSKVIAPPMVYISGEEMTRYACQLILEQWFQPYFDIHSQWLYYDLSCTNRDQTKDQVLKDAIQGGKQIGAIFKEPTITPSAIQVEQMKLSKAWPSPNGAMRRGWNGITISRDTIHIDGIELGYKNPVYFERHAVGGEYGAGYAKVGQGTLLTTYLPVDGAPHVVDKRDLTDDHNVVVVYHNPYDNVEALAHLFFQRCLDGNITPYIVTKKTVFKWQEGFWSTMKTIFDSHYKQQFLEKGLLIKCRNDLQHLISDAATMQLIRWTDGGFGMAAHNYDGDMLTDQIAQVHRSPGFITSNLVGKREDGTLIKEFEASHGTVSDLWNDHLAGRETSLNPLGLVEAMIGAMQHAATLDANKYPNDTNRQCIKDQVFNFTATLRAALHNTFRYGQGTRDMSGPSGFTTEDFIAKVAWRLQRYLAMQYEPAAPPKLDEPDRKYRRNYDIDEEALNEMFAKYDINADGFIDFEEFKDLLVKMNMAPRLIKGEKGAKVPDV